MQGRRQNMCRDVGTAGENSSMMTSNSLWCFFTNKAEWKAYESKVFVRLLFLPHKYMPQSVMLYLRGPRIFLADQGYIMTVFQAGINLVSPYADAADAEIISFALIQEMENFD